MKGRDSLRRRTGQWLFLCFVAALLLGAFTVGFLAKQRREVAFARFESSVRLAAARAAIESRNKAARRMRAEATEIVASGGAEEATAPRMDAQGIVAAVEQVRDKDETWQWYQMDREDHGPLTEAEWARIGAFLGEREDLLARIRALAASGAPWYELDFSEGFALELKHLSPLREVARLLSTQAAYDVHRGNVDTALDNVIAAFQLGDILADEPLPISQLVRVAVHGLGVAAIEASFVPGLLSAAQQQRLDEVLGGINYGNGFTQSFWMEAQLGSSYFDYLRTGAVEGGILPSGSWGNTMVTRIYTSPMARPWLDMDQAQYVEIMQRFAEASELPLYEARETLHEIESDINEMPRTRLVTDALAPAGERLLESEARATAMLQLTRLGLGIEQYFMVHGEYPDSLNAVGTGPETRVDPFTGEPYRYEHTAAGFRLYSVGANLEDDGGRHDPHEADIAWRGTAQAEVEKSHPGG